MNDLIKLITIVNSQNDELEIIEEKHEFELLGDVKDTKRTEYYASMAVSHTVSKTIEHISPDDYEMAIIAKDNGKKIRPQQVLIDGEVFNIVRTYKHDDFNMDIYCEEVDY